MNEQKPKNKLENGPQSPHVPESKSGELSTRTEQQVLWLGMKDPRFAPQAWNQTCRWRTLQLPCPCFHAGAEYSQPQRPCLALVIG